MGSPHETDRKARSADADLAQFVLELRAEDFTLQQIADRLGEKGRTTRLGKKWIPTQVSRVLRRFAG